MSALLTLSTLRAAQRGPRILSNREASRLEPSTVNLGAAILDAEKAVEAGNFEVAHAILACRLYWRGQLIGRKAAEFEANLDVALAARDKASALLALGEASVDLLNGDAALGF